jgi:Sec-independent protein translocase protein TatA
MLEQTWILAISLPGGWEWLCIGFVGLLIFGRRMPGIARAIGQSVVELRRGLIDRGDVNRTPSLPGQSLDDQ